MRRRDFLRSTLCATTSYYAARAFATAPAHIPLIDTHIHLFDPQRSGGVPWPDPSDSVIYKTTLPDRYIGLAKPLGIVGAIAVEASPLIADNDWLLNAAQASDQIVGVIGDLIPDSPGFENKLERLRGNPLFLGIRYGNLWGRSLADDLNRPGFLDGLELLSQAGLVLESANPDLRLLQALLVVSNRIPTLTIVIDHLAGMSTSTNSTSRAEIDASLRHLSAAPGVFIKLSEVAERNTSSEAQAQRQTYHGKLDYLWNIFGDDKVMFGSDWPNSDHILPLPAVVSIIQQYASTKSVKAQENVCWRNSLRAYKWRQRSLEQPRLPDDRSPLPSRK